MPLYNCNNDISIMQIYNSTTSDSYLTNDFCHCGISELLRTGRGFTTHGHHTEQLVVLAGVWGRLCLWVPGRQRLPELLLLLWGMQRWSMATRPHSHRSTWTGCLFPGLFSHLLPFVQHRLLGGLSLPLALCRRYIRRTQKAQSKVQFIVGCALVSCTKT